MIVGVVLSLGLLASTHANDDTVQLDAVKDQYPAGTTRSVHCVTAATTFRFSYFVAKPVGFYGKLKVTRCWPKIRYRYGKKVKGKGFPYSTPSVGPGADPGVQAVSLQVTVSHPPGGRLPLLSARPAVTSPAAEHHRPLAGTKLYCLVTEAHRCKQLA